MDQSSELPQAEALARLVIRTRASEQRGGEMGRGGAQGRPEAPRAAVPVWAPIPRASFVGLLEPDSWGMKARP